MPDLPETAVVTCFLRHRSAVLLRQRGSDEPYAGRWDGLTGAVGEGPPDAAARCVLEAAGMAPACTLVRTGTPLMVDDEAHGTRWVVHPYLYDCDRYDYDRAGLPAEPEAAWVAPTEILRRRTAPELWASYAQVGPSAQTIRADDTHQPAYLSLRALETLRDWAARLGWQQSKQRLTPERTRATLKALAAQLLDAQPGASLVRDRVEAVLQAWGDGSAEAMEQAADEAIRRSHEEQTQP